MAGISVLTFPVSGIAFSDPTHILFRYLLLSVLI
jgi:hypothetical protein